MSRLDAWEGGKNDLPQNSFFPQVADTSIVFPNPDGSKKKLSLKALTKEHLGQEIQRGTKGHDPKEDALAALDLMKLKISWRYYIDYKWVSYD